MQFGVFIFPTEYTIKMVDLARAAEDGGFESLWVPEHTHIPADRRSPWPGGAELPREYSHALDPFLALSAAAAVTTRLRLGTGVSLVIEKDPIATAKEVATLDQLSDGRFLFGVGGGWNLEEMANHGTDPTRRWKLMRERILAMKQIWTQDEATFHGDLVHFDRIWQWPKPVQRPHPPVVVGGNGPHTLRRVVDYGDEWMPIARPGEATIEDRIPELARLAAEAGREPIPVSIFGLRPDPRAVDHWASLGVSRCIFGLPAAGPEEVMPRLKRCAEAMQAIA
ncbi:MAG TPA: LLM class F420-dependent oxidoreductase [Chloroflexota bacterium]|nr:LLM class F420-dependent oxidoreductase [Chloroflexota bacterium]